MNIKDNLISTKILQVEHHVELSKEFMCRVIQYKISEYDEIKYNHHIFFHELNKANEFYNILIKSGFESSISLCCVFAISSNKQDIFQITGI
jgi:hypothetical protein